MINIQLILTNKTKVYSYSVSDAGVATIGSLIRSDDIKEFDIDLFDNEAIPITYEINDSIDPSKKKAPFSKTFLVPGTIINQKAFGFPYMISTALPFQEYQGSIVNENEWQIPVTEGQLFVDGILTFSGRVQLTKANIITGDVNSFEVSFLATQINIFDEIGNKLLTDLDIPTPVYATPEDVNSVFSSTDSEDTFTVNGDLYSGFTLAYPDWGFPDTDIIVTDIENPDSAIITFTVDLSSETVSSDGVYLIGTFTNPVFEGGALLMIDTGGDVYEISYEISGAEDIQYKFSNGLPNSGGSQESADFLAGGCGISDGEGGFNRLFRRSGQDETLETVLFNACPSSLQEINPVPDTDTNVTATSGKTGIWRTEAFEPTESNQVGLRLGYNITQYAYVKYLIDKIFTDVNFSYTSDFFNSDEFKTILLLYYDSNVSQTNTSVKLFGSSPTADSYFPDIVTTSVPVTSSNILGNISSGGTIPSASPFDADSGLQDPFRLFNVQSQVLKFQTKGQYTLRFKGVLDVRYGWDQLIGSDGGVCVGGLDNVYPHGASPLVGPDSKISIIKNGNESQNVNISGVTSTSQNISTPDVYFKDGSGHYQWERSYDLHSAGNFIDFVVDVEENDEIQFEFTLDSSEYSSVTNEAGCSVFSGEQRKYQFAVDFSITDVSEISHNWEQTLPNITQRDFISGILKHFNIYTEITQNSRSISFEPRDEFYSGGDIKDWTIKLDTEELRSISSDVTPYSVISRMTKTSNVIDKEFQETNADELEYGSLKSVINNEATLETEFTSIFSSLTPNFSLSLAETSFPANYIQTKQTIDGEVLQWNVPNPSLYSTNNRGERTLVDTSSIFLAYKNPNVTTIAGTGTGEVKMRAYFVIPGFPSDFGDFDYLKDGSDEPIGSHIWGISSYESPGVDINYRKTRTDMFFKSDQPPVFLDLTGAYEKYYESFYKNLNGQRIFSAKFRLTSTDISQFSFSDPIFIEFSNGDSAYFIVSSIKYDPTVPGPFDVELLTFNKQYFDFNFKENGEGLLSLGGAGYTNIATGIQRT